MALENDQIEAGDVSTEGNGTPDETRLIVRPPLTVDVMSARLRKVYGELDGVAEYLAEAGASSSSRASISATDQAIEFHQNFRQRFLRGEKTLNLFRSGRWRFFHRIHALVSDTTFSEDELQSMFDGEKKRRGKGAFGVVEEYSDLGVVMKELHIHPLTADEVREQVEKRFEREIEAAKYLMFRAPGIAPALLAQGTRDTGEKFFLMEVVSGETLKEILERRSFTFEETCALIAKIARTIQILHEQGIVHRDIKPGNIMLTNADTDPLGISRVEVKIIDLGMVKFLHRDDEDETSKSRKLREEDLTKTGDVLGTPQYIAPDQIIHPSSKKPENDFYSVGLIAYQMLTGKKPRAAEKNETIFRLLKRITTKGDSLDLRSLPPEAANAIEAFLGINNSDDPIQLFEALGEGKQGTTHARINRVIRTTTRSLVNIVKQPVVYVSAVAVAVVGAIGTILYLSKGDSDIPAVNGNGTHVEQIPPHLKVVTPAQAPHPTQTRLSWSIYADGSREPVLLLPEDMGGKTLKCHRAMNYFRGETFVGSAGVLEGVSPRTQDFDFYVDEENPEDCVLLTGNGLQFQHSSSSGKTNVYWASPKVANLPVVEKCSERLKLQDAGFESPLRQFYRRLKTEGITLRPVSNEIMKGMGGFEDRIWVKRYVDQVTGFGWPKKTAAVPGKALSQGEVRAFQTEGAAEKYSRLQNPVGTMPIFVQDIRKFTGRRG